MVTDNKLGGRRIELYIPFEFEGKGRVDAITFGPWKLDYTIRWREGLFSTEFALMCFLADLVDYPRVLRELREVDAQRVTEAFLSMIPADIRDDIANGIIPGRVRPKEELPAPEAELPAAEDQQPPPQPDSGMGFDFSEPKPEKAA